MALPRQLRAEPRSLNDGTACHKQASQVSMQPGDWSRLGILKGMIDSLPKPGERFNELSCKQNALLKSILVYLKLQMPIACTTVAGATAVARQFRKNLIMKIEGSSDYKEFPSKSLHTSKGPQI